MRRRQESPAAVLTARLKTRQGRWGRSGSSAGRAQSGLGPWSATGCDPTRPPNRERNPPGSHQVQDGRQDPGEQRGAGRDSARSPFSSARRWSAHAGYGPAHTLRTHWEPPGETDVPTSNEQPWNGTPHPFPPPRRERKSRLSQAAFANSCRCDTWAWQAGVRNGGAPQGGEFDFDGIV